MLSTNPPTPVAPRRARRSSTANSARSTRLAAKLADPSGRPARVRQLTRYLTDDRNLHDADKLAFLDLVSELAEGGTRDLQPLLDNLQSIQLAYREEVTRIFSQFATRGGSGAREKWDAYVAALRKEYSREAILTEFGDLSTEEPSSATRGGYGGNEVFGSEFPPSRSPLRSTMDPTQNTPNRFSPSCASTA